MQKLFWFLGIILVAYLSITVLLYIFQERLIFLPSSDITLTPQDIGIESEDIFFISANGNRLHGWFAENDEATHTVLYSHGNAGNMSNRISTLKSFYDMGFSVLMYDYQGYGKSEGKPGEQEILDDGLAAWDYLTQILEISPESILVVGRSLGGSVAVHIAATHQPRFLALESTFTSVPEVAAKFYPIFPIRKLAKVQLNSLEKIKDYSGALLVAHSNKDRVIPYSMGRALYDSFEGDKIWLEMGGSHYEGHLVSEPEYSETYKQFVTQYSGENP